MVADSKGPGVRKPQTLNSLNSKIKDTIQKFIQNRREFTANDIFEDLSRRERGVKKQSVITSVIKQMKKTGFAHVKVTERPGLGPRMVKLYKPA